MRLAVDGALRRDHRPVPAFAKHFHKEDIHRTGVLALDAACDDDESHAELTGIAEHAPSHSLFVSNQESGIDHACYNFTACSQTKTLKAPRR
jgi:hypothetical protein